MNDPRAVADLLGPLGAEALRTAAITAWVAHPERLREDANAEEDNARGYYRDRVVVELAQNAADAAERAGIRGRLLLRLVDGPVPTLLAANTGAPLDAAGLASMASLRASAKRDGGSVGRFGVGFAAVRSVADDIAVHSGGTAVHFSLAGTAAALEPVLRDHPALAAVVAARHGSLPALRLPFDGPGGLGPPADLAPNLGGPDAPWQTAVVLRLRDDDAVARVRAQLAAVDDTLLLALPALASVTVDGGQPAEQSASPRELADVGDRWLVATASGELPAALLADRPVEERARTAWRLTWAVPREPAHALPGVVHAPTPTDDRCTVPALLLGTFPLDPSRRHVAPGPVTDALLARAGEPFAELLLACRRELDAGRPAPDPLDLLPSGWPAGAFDAAVRDAVVAAARTAPVLRSAGDGRPLAPRDAVVLRPPWTSDARVTAVLGAWHPPLARVLDRHRGAVTALGIAAVTLSELVEQLPGHDPGRLREVYDLLAGAGQDDLAELAAAPVPLVDGRVVHGARGLVLADDDVPAEAAEALVGWGLRIVHPAAAHPVLERLGAERADAAALSRHPVLRDQVLGAGGDDDDDPEGPATVLLTLLGAAGAGPATPPEPWWGEALLPDDEGGLSPARGLTMPGSPAARWLDPDVLVAVAREAADRWGDVLGAVGVRSGLVVERVDDDIVAGALDGCAAYLEDVAPEGTGGAVGSDGTGLLAVADLDAVRPGCWPEVLAAIATGDARRALAPVRGAGGQGGPVVPSYTVWWLRHRAGLGLDRPFALAPADGGDPALAATLGGPPAAVASLDADLQRALGGVARWAELDGDGWAAVLEALPVGAPVDLAVAVEAWAAIVRLAADGALGPLADVPALPAVVRSRPLTVEVVPADDVAVADPQWSQHAGVGPWLLVPGPSAGTVAEALDLDLAAERAAGHVTSTGTRVATPEPVLALVPGVPASWVEHEDLRVDGEPVEWWVDGGVVHACTTRGLALGLATLTGWSGRDRLARLLADPAARDDVLLDLAGSGVPVEGDQSTPR